MFFCIGAQKAGTSWLHDYLSGHAEVHFSPNKELHYFDVLASRAGMALRVRVNALHVLADKLNPKATRLNRTVVQRLCEAAELLTIYTGKGDGADRHDPYLAYLLKNWQGQKLVGDITPAYAILDRAHFADMASIGRAKFIFILRDPVARMWSHIRMSVSADLGAQTPVETLQQACIKRVRNLADTMPLAEVERADYLRTMTELEAVVPTERILYVFYEDLFTGTATQDICRFLGLRHIPPAASRRVNEGVPVPLPDEILDLFRTAYARQYNGIRARFGARIPTSWRD